jgi:hypothetical protein
MSDKRGAMSAECDGLRPTAHGPQVTVTQWAIPDARTRKGIPYG